MCKKFLVSMLLMVALVGCDHRSSDQQVGDQADTAASMQDQMANSVTSGPSEAQPSVSPQAVEPTQTPPPAGMAQPGSETTNPATPSMPSEGGAATTSPTPSTQPPATDNTTSSSHPMGTAQ